MLKFFTKKNENKNSENTIKVMCEGGYRIDVSPIDKTSYLSLNRDYNYMLVVKTHIEIKFNDCTLKYSDNEVIERFTYQNSALEKALLFIEGKNSVERVEYMNEVKKKIERMVLNKLQEDKAEELKKLINSNQTIELSFSLDIKNPYSK